MKVMEGNFPKGRMIKLTLRKVPGMDEGYGRKLSEGYINMNYSRAGYSESSSNVDFQM